MIEQDVTIADPRGVHARPAARLVATAGEFQSLIELRCNGQRANARSILAIMVLAITAGTRLTVIADGPDEQAAADAVCRLLGQGEIR